MRNVEEVARSMRDKKFPERVDIIKARDAEVTQEVVEKCVKIVDDEWQYGETAFDLCVYDGLVNAIRAVATPPESPRERLGKVARKAFYNGNEAWDELSAKNRQWWTDTAAAVVEEHKRIEAEHENK